MNGWIKGWNDTEISRGGQSKTISGWFQACSLLKTVFSSSQPKSEALLTLTRANANFQIKIGNAELASKMLEDMRK